MTGYLHAIQIGNVRLEGNVFLAPMAGVSDGPFRLLCHEMGAQMAVTEMISAKAMHFDNPHTEDLLARYPGEGALSVPCRPVEVEADVADGMMCGSR